MQRILNLSKYRNFGLDKDEEFIINNTMEKGKMGDLVIVIGPNNSGKSNVLDALHTIANKSGLTNRDITTLSFAEEMRNPSISLICRTKNEDVRYVADLKGTHWVSNILRPEDKVPPFDSVKAVADYHGFAKRLSQDYPSIAHRMSAVAIPTPAENLVVSQYIDIFGEGLFRSISELRSLGFNPNRIRERYLVPSECGAFFTWLFDRAVSVKPTPDVEANEWVKRECGVPFSTQIVYYAEQQISSNDMVASADNFVGNFFFASLFKAMSIDPQEVVNAYSQYREFRNVSSLTKIKKKLNKNLDKLASRFNKMYFAEKDKYKFIIELDDSKVSFGMERGEEGEPIMISQQSTGFRWFFNFYFNLLCGNKLNPGDIVIMDEPATNLHPQGQKELRSFVKEFAIKNDITFIIATHSPFLVDPDNYDELRVISMENNKSHIDNLFTAVNMDDPDSLLPIKESLTIKQNVLYDLDTEVVWVEGITDYCYLTMFKNLLGIKDIAFIPFQGVGENDERRDEILKRLVGVKFAKRNLLCDGDKAGLSMRKKCEQTCFKSMVCVSDLSTDGKKFKVIEDLFSEEDKKKFGLLKKACRASTMKKCCKLEDFTEETINNFKALFERICD